MFLVMPTSVLVMGHDSWSDVTTGRLVGNRKHRQSIVKVLASVGALRAKKEKMHLSTKQLSSWYRRGTASVENVLRLLMVGGNE